LGFICAEQYGGFKFPRNKRLSETGGNLREQKIGQIRESIGKEKSIGKENGFGKKE